MLLESQHSLASLASLCCILTSKSEVTCSDSRCKASLAWFLKSWSVAAINYVLESLVLQPKVQGTLGVFVKYDIPIYFMY